MRADDTERSDDKVAPLADSSNSRERTDQEVLSGLLADLGPAE